MNNDQYNIPCNSNYSLKHMLIDCVNKPGRIQKGQSKMDNSEKLATLSTQTTDKQNKITTEYVLDTTIRKQTQIK